MKSCFLYKITNLIDGKLYIGMTQNPTKRMQAHFYKKLNGTISYLKRAINKWGPENFSFEIICEGSREYIAELEIKAISLYNTRGDAGYNIKPGGEKGAGYTMHYTNRDIFYYVSGFWFPNIRTALKHLNIDKSTFQKRRKEGTLGSVTQKNQKQNWAVIKVYVGGFWWPNVFVAMKSLNKTQAALVSRIKNGTLEQGSYVRDQSGPKGSMYGIDPKDHPASKPVIINGVSFDSLKQAVSATGFSKFIIKSRIKDGHPNFAYQ